MAEGVAFEPFLPSFNQRHKVGFAEVPPVKKSREQFAGVLLV
jgi:hypothetical protein